MLTNIRYGKKTAWLGRVKVIFSLQIWGMNIMSIAFFNDKKNDFFLQETSPAEVIEVISLRKPGRIYFEGSYWAARFQDSCLQNLALPGSFVKVIGRQGITLIVELLTT